MTTQSINYAEIIEGIEAEYGVEIEVRGGGRGWTAIATMESGKTLTVQSDSKGEVLSLLDNSLQENESDVEDLMEAVENGECSIECISANPSSPCNCRCGGANHPGHAVVIGPKPCKCGCGEITKRLFVAGHDARYHFAQRAAAEGLSVEDYRKALKVERNKVAAAKRREQRAAAKAEQAAK